MDVMDVVQTSLREKNMRFKRENGLIYYTEDDTEDEIIYDESGFSSGAGVSKEVKWKIAGRIGHPLTDKFVKLLKGELDENCSLCREC